MPQPQYFRLCRLPKFAPNSVVRTSLPGVLALLLFACSPATDDQDMPADMPAPTQVLEARQAGDFNEAVIWNHPQNSGQSIVFAADQTSGDLFAFAMDGSLLQSIPSDKAAGLEVRYDLVVGQDTMDVLVMLNTGSPAEIRVYAIDAERRSVERIDSGIRCTDGADGGTFTTSRASGGVFYFASHSKTGLIEQYSIVPDSSTLMSQAGDNVTVAAKMTGNKVREWQLESAGDILADDQAGVIFVAEPGKGVWRLHGAPQGETPGELRISIGENGLQNVGQLAMYKRREGGGYIMVADGEADKVHLYKRRANNAYVGSFDIKQAPENAAIAVVSAEITDRFPFGVFVHESKESKEGASLHLHRWESIADLHGFNVDNSWNPRR